MTTSCNILLLKLYVTMFPCNDYAKIIIQSGVSEVIFDREKTEYRHCICSRKLLSVAGVEFRKHQPQMNQILLQFKDL
ncbi:hypothetical protein F3Y22_tig00112044pilonHSYRG00010 [Hibiscus syriacus]|uniref:Uncharacterized protein n=1 Tax=Hibiscus syriacus TaxID=106335 RepID=A0A6A2YE54_HIBSY|nr:hypothetical protein F3Y22_tig00112044pilonHSYRG00010 [Hibiscus syriacus]